MFAGTSRSLSEHVDCITRNITIFGDDTYRGTQGKVNWLKTLKYHDPTYEPNPKQSPDLTVEPEFINRKGFQGAWHEATYGGREKANRELAESLYVVETLAHGNLVDMIVKANSTRISTEDRGSSEVRVRVREDAPWVRGLRGDIRASGLLGIEGVAGSSRRSVREIAADQLDQELMGGQISEEDAVTEWSRIESTYL
jgi:hypothetical protein